MRIGIDLGGTNVAVGLINEDGYIIDEVCTKTYSIPGARLIIEDMIKSVKELVLKNNFKLEDLSAIGIGVPGLVDYATGIVKECVNLQWKDVPLKEEIMNRIMDEFGKSFDIQILIDNDANAAAVGEYLFGSMKNAKSALLMTLGTGIGGGLILDGKLYRGKGAALEIGHMIIGKNFYNCSCGNNGCFETFASASAIIKYTQMLIEKGEKSIVLDYVDGDLNKIDAKIVFQCAELKDKVANLSINRFIKYLSIGINNIINILDLDSISLGGGVAGGLDTVKYDLIKEINKHKLYKNIKLCKIEAAVLGNEAGIIGAAMLDKM